MNIIIYGNEHFAANILQRDREPVLSVLLKDLLSFCFREVTWLKLISVFFFTFIGSLMSSSTVLFLLYIIKQRRQLKTGMQQNFTKIFFREKSISKSSTEKANKQINSCSFYLLFLDSSLGWWGEFRKSYLNFEILFLQNGNNWVTA